MPWSQAPEAASPREQSNGCWSAATTSAPPTSAASNAGPAPPEPGFGQTLIDDFPFPHIHLILHCAGIMPGGRVREVAAADALNVMDVNYGGMVRLVSWSS